MSNDWRGLTKPNERLRWARMNMYEKATDAARAIPMSAQTYRTYERDKSDEGRWPKPAKLQRIARALGVNWVWLETGLGEPGQVIPTNPYEVKVLKLIRQLPLDKAPDAINAAASVLESFIPKAG